MESIRHEPWNKGKLIGQKPPLKPKDIWAVRIHLQTAHQVRELALFNFAIDSKLRGCDLVSLRVHDVARGSQILHRTMVMQPQDPAAGTVRADRAHAGGAHGMDRESVPEVRRLPVPEPAA